MNCSFKNSIFIFSINLKILIGLLSKTKWFPISACNVFVTIKELLLLAFGFSDKLNTKEELVENEFDEFENQIKIDINFFDDVKKVFQTYLLDKSYKKIIDEKKFAELNVHPLGNSFLKLPKDIRDAIPKYIKSKEINKYF